MEWFSWDEIPVFSNVQLSQVLLNSYDWGGKNQRDSNGKTI
jgi:hypothetical protein